MKRFALAFALMSLASLAAAQSVPVKFDSTASTNATLVRPGSQLLKSLIVTNSTLTQGFLKLYDTTTTPVCNGSAVPVLKITVPIESAAGEVQLSWSDGLQFFNGIGFCLTGAIADNDNTNSVTGITINFGTKL